MINDNYLAFKAVADFKSFSKAAKELHLSKPAISIKVQALEEYYRTRLFDRNKTTNLTDSGRLLYDYVSNCMKQHELVLNAISESDGIARGNLSLAATLTIGEYILPRILGGFIKHYPEITCSMEIANSEKIAEQLVTDKINIGLIEGCITHPQLIKEKFLTDELVFIIPSHHRWSKKKYIRPKEILQEKYILRDGSRSSFEEKMRGLGINEKIEVAMELSSSQAIKEAVLAGLGVAIISTYAIQKEVQMGLLKTLRVKGIVLERELNIYYYKHHYMNKTTKCFLEILKTYYDKKSPCLTVEI